MKKGNTLKIFVPYVLVSILSSQSLLLLCTTAETAHADSRATNTFQKDYIGDVYVVVQLPSPPGIGDAPFVVPDFKQIRGKIFWGPWEGTFESRLKGAGRKGVAVVFEKKKKDAVPLTVEISQGDGIFGFHEGKPDKGMYEVIKAKWRKRY